MKHLHSIAIILLMTIITVTFTSCLGNDDNDNESKIVVFTREQRASAIASMAGTYTSTLSFTDGSTATSTWSVSIDSAVVCQPFPMKIVANALTTNNHTAAAEIVNQAPTQTLRGTIHPLYSYGTTIVCSSEYKPMQFTVGDGEDAHAVTIQPASRLTVNGVSGESCTYYANSQLQSLVLFDNVNIDGTDYAVNGGLTITAKKQ